jgi:hypothetical protein
MEAHVIAKPMGGGIGAELAFERPPTGDVERDLDTALAQLGDRRDRRRSPHPLDEVTDEYQTACLKRGLGADWHAVKPRPDGDHLAPRASSGSKFVPGVTAFEGGL